MGIDRCILLVRHGRPVVDDRTPIPGRDFGAWVRAYDDAPLDLSVDPPAALRERVRSTSCVMTSALRRSRESAALLALHGRPESDALFNEAGHPTAVPWGLTLRPVHWDAITRIAWLCGWSPEVESVTEARARAVRAAHRLVELTRLHGAVTLVGHSMMNRLINRALRSLGWKGAVPRLAYWGAAVMRP
jgi:broad specificity phosphatase PhoE